MKIEEANYNDVLKLRHEVMYPNESIELAKVENDGEGIHLGIYEEGEIVSTISIFLADRNLQFRKLATKKEYQGKGYATALLNYIIEFNKQFNFNKIWANSRVEILPLYEKLGFRKMDQIFSKNGYDYVIIEYIAEKEKEQLV